MSEQNIADDKIPTTLKQDLVQLDTIFDSTNSVRDSVSKKLESAIKKIEFSSDDPKLLEAQMAMVNTLLSSLKGSEDNASRRASAKLKQLEVESSSKYSESVTKLLAQISLGQPIRFSNQAPENNLDDLGKKIEEEYLASNLEPILESELKTDPRDLS